MRKFTNPLDNIHVASPCSANWNEMYGSEHKRFCGDCKLNVYNLSDMTRQEAGNLLLTSEGRLCVRFFRRADGTVLTKNCPVGWQAVKRRVSRVATASFSVLAGFFGGIFTFTLLQPRHFEPEVGEIRSAPLVPTQSIVGDVEFEAIQGGVSSEVDYFVGENVPIVGQIYDPLSRPQKETRRQKRAKRSR